MAIKPVTYYTVECDEPGCGVELEDLGGDYSAWAQEFAARNDWTNHDGIVLSDGSAYCEKHARSRTCSECSRVEGIDDVAVIRSDDDGYVCNDCIDAEAGESK